MRPFDNSLQKNTKRENKRGIKGRQLLSVNSGNRLGFERISWAIVARAFGSEGLVFLLAQKFWKEKKELRLLVEVHIANGGTPEARSLWLPHCGAVTPNLSSLLVTKHDEGRLVEYGMLGSQSSIGSRRRGIVSCRSHHRVLRAPLLTLVSLVT